MRYAAISPVVTGLDEKYPSMQAYYDEISAKGITGIDGRIHHFAPSTIERWYLDYKKHGFDALIPAPRADAGKSRKLDPDLQEQIRCNASLLVGNSRNLNIITADAVMQAISDCELG